LPELTEAAIRMQVASGEISLLSLDTCIFDRYRHGLNLGLLARLSQFAGTEVQVTLSDIVVREVRQHMSADAEDARSKVVSSVRRFGKYWGVSSEDGEAAIAPLIRDRTAGQVVEVCLDAFQRDAAAIVVGTAPRVRIQDLVERYFEVRVPFENKKDKRHEFPDAMALLALENYAEEQDKRMLLVSTDGGWKRFAQESPHLVCVSDLSTALSFFQALPLVVSARLAERLRAGDLPELDEEIERALSSFAEGMELYIEASSSYFFEEDLPETEILDVRYEDDPLFVPVEQDDDVYVLELTVWADARVTCSFSFSMKDWIDKDYVSVGSNTVMTEIEMPFSLTVTIEGDPDGEFQVTDVEIIQWESHVDFGEVEPDWGEPEY